MWRKLIEIARPTGRGITENVIANLVVGGLAVIGAALLAWLAGPHSDRELVGWFLYALAVLSFAWAAVAFGWHQLYPAPRTTSADPQTSNKEGLAHITWSHGRRNHSIEEPWELQVRVEFTRHAKETSCYGRWGYLEFYLNGQQRWLWSKQTTLLAAQTVHAGKVDEFMIATIPPKAPENRFMEVFGDRVAGKQNSENIICIEVVVASDTTQRERRYYGLASADRLVPVWINKSRLERVDD